MKSEGIQFSANYWQHPPGLYIWHGGFTTYYSFGGSHHTPDDGLDYTFCTLCTALTLQIPATWRLSAVVLVKYWAKRNPILLFLFVESFLFRLAVRQLLLLLFHDPPRNTRRFRPSSFSYMSFFKKNSTPPA